MGLGDQLLYLVMFTYLVALFSTQDQGEVLPPNSEAAEATTVTAAPHGIEIAVEFKPVECPMEPLDTDRPIRCPLPEPSIRNVG